MTRQFPANVVRTTDRFSTELRQSEGVGVDDIAHLWKAYTTQNAVMRDVVGSRLENLFWRIWGNATIQQSLTGITLATLFMAIHEDSSFQIPICHKPSPEATQSLSASGTTEASSSVISRASDDGRKESLPTRESKTRLPPILKKPSDGKKSLPPSEPSSHKTTKFLVPERSSQRTTKEKGTAAAENEKANKPETPTTSTVTTQKPNRKRPSFVANRATSSRRRGVLVRRKSSQTSPVTSPAAEYTEENLQEHIETAKDKEIREGTAPPSPANEPELTWQSMSYLKKLDEEKRKESTEPDAETPGTSPRPTNFSLSSVHRHRSPEEHFQLANREITQERPDTDTVLVNQDFRMSFAERQRQGSVLGTRNNSAASSLTTKLSSTNFRELLNAAETAAAAVQKDDNRGADHSISPKSQQFILPKHRGITGASAALASPTLKESKDRSRRPAIINTSSKGAEQQNHDRKELLSSHPSAVAVAESVTSTSQQTTSGVFSVPKESQEHLGKHLNSLIKGKGAKDGKKTKR